MVKHRHLDKKIPGDLSLPLGLRVIVLARASAYVSPSARSVSVPAGVLVPPDIFAMTMTMTMTVTVKG